ncbi:uncharacterized protein LOC131956811 [Physella acuta]|uniref:uncharacterized protein LOC131956811 n=1 Tax=Physella acuta TaxID=109671 RepID=UPI0027DC16C5|nr:uncharacterized protein LOC131956811 [Physella acuta]
MDIFQYFDLATTEEEIREGVNTWVSTRDKCQKLDHNRYISLRDFTEQSLRDLDEGGLDDGKLCGLLAELIKCMGKLSVYIEYPHCKHVVVGTGFIQRIRRVNREDSEMGHFTITTCVNVVRKMTSYDEVKVVLFYDEHENEGKIRSLKLDKIPEFDENQDWCSIECVSQDLDVVERLESCLARYEDHQKKVYQRYIDAGDESCPRVVALVGYPHGMPTTVSLGHVIQKKTLHLTRDGKDWCRYAYDTPTCPGSSGSPVFILGQPLAGFGYWFGHPHNHSRGYCGLSGEPVGFSCVGADCVGF